jgi:hypothetical protein
MQKAINGFLAIALFGAFSLSAGCAARDVDVSNRGGVRSDTNVESNSSSSTSSSQTQQNQKPGHQAAPAGPAPVRTAAALLQEPVVPAAALAIAVLNQKSA